MYIQLFINLLLGMHLMSPKFKRFQKNLPTYDLITAIRVLLI